MRAPWFWLAEKQDKKAYLLGTLHRGISLEDLACSNQITDYLINSDLVFVEHVKSKPLLDLLKNSVSREEFEKGLEELPEKDRQIMEQRKLVVSKLIHSHFVYNGDEEFEDLSPTAQNFLINKNVDLQGNYADYIAALYEDISLKMLFSSPKRLDYEISAAALSYGIPLQSLDDNDKILEDIQEADLELKEVSRMFVEDFIREGYERRLQNLITSGNLVLSDYSHRKTGVFLEFSLWLAGAIVWAVEFYMEDDVPPVTAVTLKNRNERWLKKLNDISSLEQNNNIFLAAGLNHFTDWYNLINMLKEDGYIVKRMSADCTFSDTWLGDSSKGVYLL